MTTSPAVPDMKATIETLPDEAFREVMYWIVTDEKRRRESVASSNAARVEMVKAAREADSAFRPAAREDGVFEWAAPTSIFGAFLPGEIVASGGEQWHSVDTGPNMDAPGESASWEEYAPRPEPQPAATESEPSPADPPLNPEAMDLPEDPAPAE